MTAAVSPMNSSGLPGSLSAPLPRMKQQLQLASIAPGQTDRATLVGMTGSGKTTLAEMLCGQRHYVVAYDPKGTLSWKTYTVHQTLRTLFEAEEARIIYRPVYGELRDAGAVDDFFAWIYERQNCCIYVDEIYAISTATRYPEMLHACLTRGRERQVVVYSATQRPKRCPAIIFSEAEHVYAFTLKLSGDRDTIEEVTGIPADMLAPGVLPKHRFFYAPQDDVARGPLRLNL